MIPDYEVTESELTPEYWALSMLAFKRLQAEPHPRDVEMHVEQSTAELIYGRSQITP